MSKLQPNFSWQKYEGRPEDQQEQFQYQLQTQHILVANSVNATIDDESYFSRERMTSFTWIDNKPIWKKTITGTLTGVGTLSYPHGITNINTIIRIEASAQSSTPFTGTSSMINLPHVDTTAVANNVAIVINGPNVLIVVANAIWVGYTFQVTIYYTKTS